MAAKNQTVPVVQQEGCYRIDYETPNFWKSVYKKDGSMKIMKFKTIEDAQKVRRLMGIPRNKTRIIDEIKGRRVN